MHDADAGPRSEIGKIGSWRSFLRATHVPSLQYEEDNRYDKQKKLLKRKDLELNNRPKYHNY